MSRIPFDGWNLAFVDRADAEAIALAGGEPARELVVRLLDALDRVAAAVDEVAGLRERVLELERQLNRTSRNSSVAQQFGCALVGSAVDASAASSARA